MIANPVQATTVLRHGAYVCLRVPQADRQAVARAPVAELAARLGLVNEFAPGDGHPPSAIAFVRRTSAASGSIADDGLLGADAIVHVATEASTPVDTFLAELSELLGPALRPRVLRGVVRPMSYTGNAMHDFAYAHQVVQQSGGLMPNVFLIPMSKTPAWWAKDWMERHTYFLPRYDESGHMAAQGHALAAAAGIPHLLRRTYKSAFEPAPDGAYDFITYFECADEHVATFHAVCAALRDVAKNPEWKFVREGPTWQGRRVATWPDLFA